MSVSFCRARGAADHDFWSVRPVEASGSRPLDFEFGGSLGAKAAEWPIGHAVKCLGFRHPDDSAELEARHREIGIKLDWWKLEPQATAEAWANVAATIDVNDPFRRGIMLPGLEAPQAELASAFRVARTRARVSGFAVGRMIFVEPARKWFAGAIGDAATTRAMAESFARLVALWQDAAPGGAP